MYDNSVDNSSADDHNTTQFPSPSPPTASLPDLPLALAHSEGDIAHLQTSVTAATRQSTHIDIR